jgi:glycolate oxidase iron-sulfur subunit
MADVQPAFDTYHPPQLQIIEDCVHCGFCLPSCPTYVLWGEEMDSPRGRIYLMREGLEGDPLTATVVEHWDRCLGCLACVTACPSGVRYDRLIEDTRQQVERRYPRSFGDRLSRALLFRLAPYPRRLEATRPLVHLARATLGRIQRGLLSRLLPQRLVALQRLADGIPSSHEGVAEVTPAASEERYRVGLVLGCVQRAFFSTTNAATARVLAAEGCTVLAPGGQGCCGALSLHAGREEEARRFARSLIQSFEPLDLDAVIVNVAGCGSAMKEYGYLLRDDPIYAERAERFATTVRDASEFLADITPRAERHPVPLSVVYHDACHLAHGQGIRTQPRSLLQSIPGLELREVPREREMCCGSAGVYNLLQPGPAWELGRRKARSVADTGADVLVTANPGCHLQISAALATMEHPMRAVHVMDLLDASINATPLR